MINSSGSANIVWNMDYSNIVNPQVCTTSANSSSSNNITFSYFIPRCRACKHGHSQTGGEGCYDLVGTAITFIICRCKEHVPEDNLEYLEYLSKKKESL